MAEMDIMAAMGITGFGKAVKKKQPQLDAGRFDKTKRFDGEQGKVRVGLR